MFFLAFADIQLLPDGSLLIHIAMIMAMIWILNRTFFRPINKIIETRGKNKGGQFGEAEGILKEASDKNSEYTEALQSTRSEAYELIEKERSEAMAQKQSKINGAKNEVAQMLTSENAEMEKQIASAREAIATDAEKMAQQISSDLLKGVS